MMSPTAFLSAFLFTILACHSEVIYSPLTDIAILSTENFIWVWKYRRSENCNFYYGCSAGRQAEGMAAVFEFDRRRMEFRRE